jgi:hypothetical protein
MTRVSPKKSKLLGAIDKEDQEEEEPVSDDQICALMCRVFQSTPGPIPTRLQEVLDVVEKLVRLRVLREVVDLIDRPRKVDLPDAKALIRRMIQDAKR